MQFLTKIQQSYKGLLIAAVIGTFSVFIAEYSQQPILDPLLLALVMGIILNSVIKFNSSYTQAFSMAPGLFIPIGVIFYGAANLNFSKIYSVEPTNILLIIIVAIIYILTILILSSILRIKDKTCFLLVAGSAICGASAIAITSKSIEAEPDDISKSLIPIFIAALIGLFIILPFVNTIFRLTNMEYSVLSGTVLQFTGFVKAAVSNFSAGIQNVALSVKALRYMGLLFLIPLFSSISRGRFYIPWFLWAFLCAGIVFSLLPADITDQLRPVFKIILSFLWSMAMAAIGLNANIRSLFTKSGLCSLIISVLAFIIAVSIFLAGLLLGG